MKFAPLTDDERRAAEAPELVAMAREVARRYARRFAPEFLPDLYPILETAALLGVCVAVRKYRPDAAVTRANTLKQFAQLKAHRACQTAYRDWQAERRIATANQWRRRSGYSGMNRFGVDLHEPAARPESDSNSLESREMLGAALERAEPRLRKALELLATDPAVNRVEDAVKVAGIGVTRFYQLLRELREQVC